MADMGNFHLAQRNSVVPFKFLWEITHWDKRFNGVDNHKQVEIRRYSYLLASELKTLAAPGGNIKLLNTGAGDFGFTTAELAGNNLADGEIISVPWGGTPSVQYHKGPFVTADNRIAVSRDTEVIRTRFLYFALLAQMPQITKLYRGSGIKHPDMNKLLDLRIPIPPIEIQDSIVSILDNFLALEVELEAELKARLKQFANYSERLLSVFPEDSKTVKISEICRITRGRVISKDYLRSNTGIYPVYSSQTLNNGIFGLIDTYDFDSESVTWTTDGANAGSIFYHNNEKFSLTNVCGLLQPLDPDSVSMKYLAHVLKKVAPKYVKSGMGNPKLMSGVMGDIALTIPNLELQNKVATILDTFENLVSERKGGIPSELSARRKQYEHFRQQLLAFKEA